jgi:hypothetical protein
MMMIPHIPKREISGTDTNEQSPGKAESRSLGAVRLVMTIEAGGGGKMMFR